MRQVTIPINDDGDVCNQGYIVEYKVATEPEYTQLLPNPLGSPVIIQNMEDDTAYDIRIKRICCNNDTSDWTEIELTTTVNSPL